MAAAGRQAAQLWMSDYDWSSGSEDEHDGSDVLDGDPESEFGCARDEIESETVIHVFDGRALQGFEDVSEYPIDNNEDDDDDVSASGESYGSGAKTPIMASRAYQQEMFEESMKQNIIVAVSCVVGLVRHGVANMSKMDTGSGKTQV
jgi:hypothetical protein